MRRMLTASLQLRVPPAPREVHLWCLFPEDVHDPDILHTYHSILSPAEQLHVAAANSEALRRERLLARALVRTSLAKYCGGLLGPKQLKFRSNRHGKPKFDAATSGGSLSGSSFPSLQFNLSHTHSLIACGVTTSDPIGIDVEDTSRVPRRDVLALARKKYSSAEVDWLQQCTSKEERRLRFLQLWTLKEAYVKAIGMGIQAAPLRDFTFDLRACPGVSLALQEVSGFAASEEAQAITLTFGDQERTLERHGAAPDAFECLLLQPTRDHYAAICLGQASPATRECINLHPLPDGVISGKLAGLLDAGLEVHLVRRWVVRRYCRDFHPQQHLGLHALDDSQGALLQDTRHYGVKAHDGLVWIVHLAAATKSHLQPTCGLVKVTSSLKEFHSVVARRCIR
eukprot:SM000050S17006  [mRNA]  locus=s50:330254:334202:- [translate_table: standard]